MKVSVNTLPSKGYGTTLTEVEIVPMTYSELLRYMQEYSKDDKKRLLTDIDLILGGIRGAMSLNLYDLKILIFTRKYMSGTFNSSFKTEINGKTLVIDTNKINFYPLDDQLLEIDSVKLGNKEFNFNIPSIGYFRNVLFDIVTNYSDTNIKFVYLMSLLGYLEDKERVYSAVTGATQSDIILLESLYKKIANPIKAFNAFSDLGGDETVIDDVNDTITDLFRFINLNNEIHPEQIKVK